MYAKTRYTTVLLNVVGTTPCCPSLHLRARDRKRHPRGLPVDRLKTDTALPVKNLNSVGPGTGLGSGELDIAESPVCRFPTTRISQGT